MIANSRVLVKITGEKCPPVKVKALLDSGNNTANGVVISEKLHNRLQCSFLKLGGKVLGAGNQKLKVKGVSSPIKLELNDKTFEIKPVVIEGLTNPINIGRTFMKKYGIALQFGPQDMMVSEGKEIVMIKSLEEPRKPTRGREQQKGQGARVRQKKIYPKL